MNWSAQLDSCGKLWGLQWGANLAALTVEHWGAKWADGLVSKPVACSVAMSVDHSDVITADWTDSTWAERLVWNLVFHLADWWDQYLAAKMASLMTVNSDAKMALTSAVWKAAKMDDCWEHWRADWKGVKTVGTSGQHLAKNSVAWSVTMKAAKRESHLVEKMAVLMAN